MIKNTFSIMLLAASTMLLAMGCTKTASNLKVPPSLAKFVGEPSQTYTVDADPAPPYRVQVSVTGAADQDRTVTVSVSSTTGAVPGTHYTVTGLGAGNQITIPAGEMFAEFFVQADYDEYISGRKDTLQIKLDYPGMAVADYNNTINLALRGPCFDGDIAEEILQSMLGTYNNSFDEGFESWGPYPTTVVSITQVSATTARAVINNVFDYDLGNIPFLIDWSDPANVTIDVAEPTILAQDAGIISSTYAGDALVIAAPTDPGTASNRFSVCNNRINLRYVLGVARNGVILGYFPVLCTTEMRR